MARVGYARVSTGEQNLHLQGEALTAAGVERIFEDVISGGTTSRPGLDAALDYLRDGDDLVVWRLDRFSRSTVHALTAIDELANPGVAFRSLTRSRDSRVSHAQNRARPRARKTFRGANGHVIRCQ
jgi:DNA invertase Pin-like site-specific DNA recombinase